jgi:uncharacterized membrane protein YbhN (UPF0104 family)
VDRLQVLLQRVTDLLDRVSEKTETPRGRKVAMLVSAVIFILAMVLGLEALPSGERDLRWWPIIASSVIGVPILVVLNGMEYVASGAVLGHRISFRDSLPVAIYARAANLLPIPGAALIRMQALKRQGSTYGKAASATMAVALYWLGTSLVVGGIVLVPSHVVLALLIIGGGGLACVLGHVAVRGLVARRTDDPPPSEALRRSAQLFAVEAGIIVIRGLRFWLLMIGFDLGGSFAGAMVLPVAGVLASAIGFFPSGLGIREVISGGLSRLVGDTAASGVLASGLDHVVSLPVMAVLTLIVALLGKKPDLEAPEPDAPAPAADDPATRR